MSDTDKDQVQYGLRLNRAFKNEDMDALMSVISSYMLNAGLNVSRSEIQKFFDMNLIRDEKK